VLSVDIGVLPTLTEKNRSIFAGETHLLIQQISMSWKERKHVFGILLFDVT
jgi:hypothetical protein